MKFSKKIINIHGSIAECGVNAGQGLFTFAKLSSILEPYNYTRQILGFDTFEGFPELTNTDKQSKSNLDIQVNTASYTDFQNIEQDIRVFDDDRVLNKIEKIKIIKGDITKTIPEFVIKIRIFCSA